MNPSLTITALSERAMSHIPVKAGAEERHAVDPTFQAKRVAEIEALAKETGSASLQRHLPIAKGHRPIGQASLGRSPDRW